MNQRQSTFALAVTEITDAWRNISREEEAMRRPVCTLCYGQGTAMVYDPKTDTEFEKECPYCFGKVSTELKLAG
jgi:hypothetical protein